ncbi:hypothetical protein [Corynebacterium glyciniphilum]|uniref:hypothetical protein n=1 Tax=Corynebacterium glyciniphilum TaxID=1404244 RepID=UPI0011AB3A3F|nr:hypothetical protein [Corynebacterium glyciniphilum]
MSHPPLTSTTMRSPWERLRADRPPSTTLVFLLLIVVLAFLTSSTLVQFHRGWQPWPAVTGGIFFPALSVLMLLPNPARYRVVELSMRQWMVDHGMLVALVAVIHLAWPVWAVVRPVDDAEQVPVWMPVLPALAISGVLALVFWHHRHVLSGRAVGTGVRFTGTPLHYRVFLARRGPVAWRTVYQPVGLTALVTVLVILVWRTYEGDNQAPAVVTSSFLVASLITAPVVAAGRTTAMAVGLSRRAWVLHTLAAISVPQLVLALPFSYQLAEVNPHVSTEPVRLAIYVGVVLTSAVAAAAFAVSVSYEDWGTAIAWLIGFGFVFGIVGGFGFGTSDALWPNLIALAGNVLLAWCLVSYARGKALLGQPDWTMTSIIGGPRMRRNRLGS